MIDFTNTSPDWQKHRTDLIVLPVGSMEQHSSHLPLNTDTVIAEHAAKMIAEHFDAALLPSLAIANCLEHSGFRGSFSLRPETLMQVIHDIADEAEAQNFKIMIIVNGHGGNHSLVPVCRDINRRDRKIKIILHNAFEFASRECLEAGKSGIFDMHAGETETSIYTAVTGKKPLNLPSVKNNTGGPVPLRQADLTLFGVGFLNQGGAIGSPGMASMEKGIKLCETMKQPMLDFIADRIARLRHVWRYSGPGGLAVRELTEADMPGLGALTEQVNWNQTDFEWRLFMKHGHLLGMLHQGRIAGTAAAAVYSNKLAWIGLVITDNDFRRLGIASRLMEAILEKLSSCPTVKLDASADGAKVYEKLGFKGEGLIRRFSCAQFPALENIPDAATLTASDIDSISEMAARFDGAERQGLFGDFLSRWPAYGIKTMKNGRLSGFCLGRKGRVFRQAGPLFAENMEDALSLLKRFAVTAGSPLILDVPEKQTAFIEELKKLGFRHERDFLRMGFGKTLNIASGDICYSICGPEFG